MANDSDDVQNLLDFHPCNTPRGTTYYKLEELSAYQQTCLNEEKINITREHQKYLCEHPEIRTFVGLVFKELLLNRPMYDVPRFIEKFVLDSWNEIEAAMLKSCIQKPKDEESVPSDESLASNKSNEEDRPGRHVHIFESLPNFSQNADDAIGICSEIIEDIVKKVEGDEERSQIDKRKQKTLGFFGNLLDSVLDIS